MLPRHWIRGSKWWPCSYGVADDVSFSLVCWKLLHTSINRVSLFPSLLSCRILQQLATMCCAQEQRRSALEEKLRVIQSSRDELQTYASQQAGLVGELQSRNSQLTIDGESLRRRVADLQQVRAPTDNISTLSLTCWARAAALKRLLNEQKQHPIQTRNVKTQPIFICKDLCQKLYY